MNLMQKPTPQEEKNFENWLEATNSGGLRAAIIKLRDAANAEVKLCPEVALRCFQEGRVQMAQNILELLPDQPQAISAGALDDSFARIIKDLREAKATINGKPVMEIFASLNWMADRIEIALAAHDQKVRAEVLREAAELLDKWLNEKWVGAPADVIRSLAASAASKPAQAKES